MKINLRDGRTVDVAVNKADIISIIFEDQPMAGRELPGILKRGICEDERHQKKLLLFHIYRVNLGHQSPEFFRAKIGLSVHDPFYKFFSISTRRALAVACCFLLCMIHFWIIFSRRETNRIFSCRAWGEVPPTAFLREIMFLGS